MCGGDGGASAAAQRAEQNEKSRQQRVRQGMAQLNAMFGGGTYGTGMLPEGAAYDPTRTYYDAQGVAIDPARFRQEAVQAAEAYDPGIIPGGSTYVPPTSEGANVYNEPYTPERRQETIDWATGQKWKDSLAEGVFGGTATSGGYEPYYQKAYQAQLDYALPEVDRQFKEAQRQLTYGLARQSMGASSVAGDLASQLEGNRQQAVQGAQEQARSARDTMQTNVENERNNLVQMLNSTGELDQVMNMAQSRQGLLQSPPALQQMGPLFQNATASLADMYVNPALRASAQRPSAGYGSRKGSGRLVT